MDKPFHEKLYETLLKKRMTNRELVTHFDTYKSQIDNALALLIDARCVLWEIVVVKNRSWGQRRYQKKYYAVQGKDISQIKGGSYGYGKVWPLRKDGKKKFQK